MNGRTRTLLALAMSTAMLAPAAFAQKVGAEVKTTGNATSQTAREMSRPTLPPQATQRAADVTKGVRDIAPQAMPAAAPASQPLPPTSKGAVNAAAHSSVVQRDAWMRLDADGDGRISPTEADVDSSFDTSFDAMDSNDDGFVSDTEYRAHAKVDASQGAAHAAAHSSVVQRDLWTRLDADGDGRISAAEADADTVFDSDFDAMDSDDDGFISDTEYRVFAKVDASQGAAHAAAHSSVVQRGVWARLDADGDGRISAGEADADTAFDGDFDAMDSNDDGFISDTEYRAFAKRDASQGAAHAAGHSAVVQRDTWARLDADADGRISATEADADAGFDSRFATMDGNGDGFITDAEFRAQAKAARTP